MCVFCADRIRRLVVFFIRIRFHRNIVALLYNHGFPSLIFECAICDIKLHDAIGSDFRRRIRTVGEIEAILQGNCLRRAAIGLIADKASLFQLSHVNRIRIFTTCCYVSNLTGQEFCFCYLLAISIVILIGCSTTDRNSPFCRSPGCYFCICSIRQIRKTIGRFVIRTVFFIACCPGSYRTSTDSHAAALLSTGRIT